MLDFLAPKTKLKAFDIIEVDIENFQVFGISQINPYCRKPFENEVFTTLVNIANDSRDYGEKEGFVLTTFFSVKKCPVCKRKTLIPVEFKINALGSYLRNEEKYAYAQFFNSLHNFPSRARAYCNHCSSCFEVIIKNNDVWVKEAKKLKEKDLIEGEWHTYLVD